MIDTVLLNLRYPDARMLFGPLFCFVYEEFNVQILDNLFLPQNAIFFIFINLNKSF